MPTSAYPEETPTRTDRDQIARRRLSRFMLVAAAAIWGSTYTLSKEAIADISVQQLLAIRMFGGIVLMWIFFGKRIISTFTVASLRSGVIGGILYYGAFLLQTVGLRGMPPGRNAFLTASYCVLTPFLMWVFRKRAPGVQHIGASLLCLIGVGFVASSQSGGLASGTPHALSDAMTLLGAVGWALYFFLIAMASVRHDPITLTFIVFCSSFALFLVGSLIWERQLPSLPLHPRTLWAVAILLLATFAAQVLQNLGIAGTPPNEASILLCTETLFALILSILVYSERPTPVAAVGFALIFGSVMLSEIANR